MVRMHPVGGTVTISASGTGSETELNFELVFKALAEGDSVISVAGSTAYLYSDETLNLQPGNATVRIGSGDGSASSNNEERQVGAENIEVAGTMYGIYENFTEALIPEGFVKTTFTFNGEEHNGIVQESSGKTMVYLIAGSNDPVMGLYDEADNKIIIAEQVSQGENFYLFILGESDGSTLPEQFQSTTIEINGTNFPAWQNMQSQDYFLLYALSSAGQEGYYQYDSVEGTYQRYTVEETEAPKEEEPEEGVLGKVKGLVDQYLLVIAAAIAAGFLLLFIILIVLSVKLHLRNRELDEFYDEYDENTNDREEDFDDEYDEDGEYDEDDEYDDEYDEYDDDEYDEYDDDEYDDDEYDDEYDEDDDEEFDEKPVRRGRKTGGSEKKERGYDVDFIDL